MEEAELDVIVWKKKIQKYSDKDGKMYYFMLVGLNGDGKDALGDSG